MRNIENGGSPRITLERTTSNRRPLSMYQLYEKDEKLVSNNYSTAVRKAKSLKGKNKIAALREAVDLEINSDIDLDDKIEFLERLKNVQSNYREGSYLNNKMKELIFKTQHNISYYQHKRDLEESEKGLQNLIDLIPSRFEELQAKVDARFSELREKYAPNYMPKEQPAPVSPLYGFQLVAKATQEGKNDAGPVSKIIEKAKGIYSNLEGSLEGLDIRSKAAALVLGATLLTGSVKVGLNKLQARSNYEQQNATREYETTRSQLANSKENNSKILTQVTESNVLEVPFIQQVHTQKQVMKSNLPQYSVAWHTSNSSGENPILISSHPDKSIEGKVSNLQKIFNYEGLPGEPTVLTPQPQKEISEKFAVRDHSSMGLISGENPETAEFPSNGLVASDALGNLMWSIHQGREKAPQKIPVTTASSRPTHYELVVINENQDPRTIRPVAFINTSTVKNPLLTAEKRRRRGNSPQGQYLELRLGEKDSKKVEPVIYISTN